MATNNATNTPELTANGQLIIGNGVLQPIAATLTAGVGISIANGAGSITITNTGAGATWVDQTSSPVTMAVNTSYVTDDGASLLTYTLPVTAALGSVFEIAGKSAGGWTLTQQTGQIVHIGTQATTVTTGSLSSTNQWDCIRLVCVTANTTFTVLSSYGNITFV